MQPHEERVVTESKELWDKIVKLTEFIENNEFFNTLSQEEKFLLKDQLYAMHHYLNILNKRIARFS